MVGAALVIAVFVVVAAIVTSSGERSIAPATRPDGSPAGALPPEPVESAEPVAPSSTASTPEAAISRSVDRSVHVRQIQVFPDSQVFVTWQIQSGGATTWRAQRDATMILQGIRNSGVPVTSVRLIGKVDAVNQFGQTATINGVIATYTAATIAAINFDQFDPENVFDANVARDPDVHPLLRD